MRSFTFCAALSLALCSGISSADQVHEMPDQVLNPPHERTSQENLVDTTAAQDRFLNEERMIQLELGAFHIRSGYFQDVSEDELMINALKGMFHGLDPYSTFLTTKEFEDMVKSMSGKLAGIGAELRADERCPALIVRALPDSPAEKMKLQKDDCVVKVNGSDIRGMPLEKIITLVRGEPGTKVTLEIIRKDVGLMPPITLVRAEVSIASVYSRMIAPGIGYIQITRFNENVDKDFAKQVNVLKKRAGGKLSGLVFDLRGNPGGYMKSCTDLVDMLIAEDEKVIVSEKGRVFEESIFTREKGEILSGVPIVLLVDNGSASASEVLAGALQDYRRAILVGEVTYGKGVVQTLNRLWEKKPEWGYVKYTKSEYFRPSGKKVHGVGITPDVPISRPQGEASFAYDERMCVQDPRLSDEKVAVDCLPKDTVLQAGLAKLKELASPGTQKTQ